jgi:hypothetical protein
MDILWCKSADEVPASLLQTNVLRALNSDFPEECLD